MPRLTLWRRDNGEIRFANASFRAIGCGRGPTIDMSDDVAPVAQLEEAAQSQKFDGVFLPKIPSIGHRRRH
jgi:hypothetical protein